MAMFKGFKPQAMNKIAGAMGYQGDMNQFQQYVDQDPARQQQMNMYTNAARKMAAGGYARRFNEGGFNPATRYMMPTQGDDDDPKYITIGSPQDTAANRQLSTNKFSEEVSSAFKNTSPYQAPAQQPATQPPASAPAQPMPQPDPLIEGKPVGVPIRKPVGQPVEQPDPQPQPPSNRGIVTNPAGTQAGTPTFTGASDNTVYDAFAPFRQNVEVYSETGAFKNPNLQSSHDTMLEVLTKEEEADNPLAPVKQEKTNAIVDYLRNIYTGPIYNTETGATGLGANQFTEDFAQFANAMGIEIDNSLAAADGPPLLKIAEGNPTLTQAGWMPQAPAQQPGIGQFTTEQMYQPGVPIGGTTIAAGIQQDPNQMVAAGTGTLTGPYLESDPTPGVVRPTVMPQEGNKFAFTPDGTRFEVPISYDFSAGAVQVPTATANTYQAESITASDANKAAVTTTESDIDAEMKKVAAAQGSTSGITAAQGALSTGATPGAPEFDTAFKQGVGFGDLNVTPDQLAEAKGQDEVVPAAKIAESSGIDPAIAQQATVSVNEIPQAAQIQESNMAQAQLAQSGGFLREDAVAYAAKLNSFSVDNETLASAIQGEVGALGTVQGQLEGLMKQFDDGTPVWAAGALRAANAAMASRGLAGSSMAGAAILQAAMESSLPIATQDAQTFNQMNMSNLDRRQQVALTNAAAQQGLALQNLSNEQQVALQNSTNAFALQTQDLSNMQQTFLANAQIKAAFQGQNLSNQQQVNLVTAARFAEVANMNLNNRQQTALVNNANNLQVDLANLSNRQQSYMANAQLSAALQGKQIDIQQQTAMQNAARFSEAANITFSADQQEQLHNSELMKTIGLANLNTAQATTLQNAATIAAMDSQNLSNRQQASVQQAQNFLQMDMANLSNEQQTELFKAQQRVQSLFSDQAATNAAAQFNASSENQVDQFFQNLGSQVSQFNATQSNAQSQYNAGQANTVNRFNAELNNQRDQFNAQNQLVIAQSNAQWRRQIATADTASVNRANELNANAILDISKTAYDNLWNYYGDTMEWAWKSANSELDRMNNLAIAELSADATLAAQKSASSSAAGSALGGLLGTLGSAYIGSKAFTGFGF